MSNKVRIGFVGVGGMGQCAHLINYAQNPDCEVVALAELRPEWARQVAARYGVAKVYPSHDKMLAAEKLDGIVASQPFGRHASLVPDLLKVGIPVLTEKPIAKSVAAGEIILKAAKASKGKLFLAYHKRSDPATLAMMETIASWKASGQFGKMKYIRVTMPPGDWIAEGFRPLLKTAEPYPTLAENVAESPDKDISNAYVRFVNYYIHQVNYIRHVLGEDYKVTYADPTGVLLAGVSNSNVSVALEMAPYNNTRDWQEAALVCFEKGWLKVELPAPVAHARPGKLTVYEDPSDKITPKQWSPTLPHVHAMRQQAAFFIAAIKGEKTPLCGPEDALKDLQTAREYLDLFLKTK